MVKLEVNIKVQQSNLRYHDTRFLRDLEIIRFYIKCNFHLSIINLPGQYNSAVEFIKITHYLGEIYNQDYALSWTNLEKFEILLENCTIFRYDISSSAFPRCTDLLKRRKKSLCILYNANKVINFRISILPEVSKS